MTPSNGPPLATTLLAEYLAEPPLLDDVRTVGVDRETLAALSDRAVVSGVLHGRAYEMLASTTVERVGSHVTAIDQVGVWLSGRGGLVAVAPARLPTDIERQRWRIYASTGVTAVRVSLEVA